MRYRPVKYSDAWSWLGEEDLEIDIEHIFSDTRFFRKCVCIGANRSSGHYDNDFLVYEMSEFEWAEDCQEDFKNF